jgi:hypothetical protein
MKAFSPIPLASCLLACWTSIAAHAVTIQVPTATKGTYDVCVSATWAADSNARFGYYVYRTPTAKFQNAIRLGKTANRFWVDRTAASGRRYWYWIAPIHGRTVQYRTNTVGQVRSRQAYYVYRCYAPKAGTTARACQDGWKAFSVPTPSVARGTSTSRLYLSWLHSPQARYGYRIYRSTTPSFWSSTAIATTYNRYYYDATAMPGRTYYYWIAVRGFNVVSYNPYRAGSGKLALAVPVPTGSRTRLSWSSVRGAARYQIYQGTNIYFSCARCVATTTLTQWQASSSSGGALYWWIAPVDAEGNVWYNASAYLYDPAVTLQTGIGGVCDGGS